MPCIDYDSSVLLLVHDWLMFARPPISLLRSLRRVSSLDGYFAAKRQAGTTYEANMTIDCEDALV
jgi:hypothetical protein